MIRELVQLPESEIYSKQTPLRRTSQRVTDFGQEFQQLVQDLKDTLVAHDIAIGLAAPQIGKNLRVAVVNISKDRSEPTMVFANPRDVVWSGKRDKKRESCMSIPHFGGEVERRNSVKFTYDDDRGNAREMSATGFLARVFCHEIDHLDGFLYVDRMKSDAKLESVDFFPKSNAESA